MENLGKIPPRDIFKLAVKYNNYILFKEFLPIANHKTVVKTMFVLAVKKGFNQMVIDMVDFGVDHNELFSYRSLITIVEKNNVELLEYMTKFEFKFKNSDFGNQALWTALHKKYFKIAELLLHFGAIPKPTTLTKFSDYFVPYMRKQKIDRIMDKLQSAKI
jgi:hypothetical protein